MWNWFCSKSVLLFVDIFVLLASSIWLLVDVALLSCGGFMVVKIMYMREVDSESELPSCVITDFSLCVVGGIGLACYSCVLI